MVKKSAGSRSWIKCLGGRGQQVARARPSVWEGEWRRGQKVAGVGPSVWGGVTSILGNTIMCVGSLLPSLTLRVIRTESRSLL